MTRILPALLIGASLICGGAHAQDRMERLTLNDGTTSIKGKIEGYDGVQYSLTAKPNQQLTIRLTTSNPSSYINVERAGMAEAICQGSLTGNVCTVRSETAADYVIDVFLMRNAARRGESAKYTLSIDQGVGNVGKATDAAKEAGSAAVAACKSALALKSGANSVFVLPISNVPSAGGYEVFLSLKGAQWLCTTDSRGNVNRLEQR